MHVFVILIIRVILQTAVFNAIQQTLCFLHLMVFFVVIDLKHHVVGLLQLKPVHAVLQQSNSGIQINVQIFLMFTVCNSVCFCCCLQLVSHMHGNVILWNH